MFVRFPLIRLFAVAASALLLSSAAQAGYARGCCIPVVTPEERRSLALPIEHLAAMTPEQRQQMRRQMRDHWQQMPPDQRRYPREGWQQRRESWQPLAPEERRQWREQRQEWQQFRDQRQGQPQWQPYRDPRQEWREERAPRGDGRGGRWR